MKRLALSTIAVVSLALSAGAAESGPKDEITKAAKQLGEKENYSWRTTVVVPEDAPFKPGPTDGKIEKDGFTLLNISFGDIEMKAVLKGDKGAASTEGGWQTLAELANSEGPERFMAMRLQTFKAPAAQVEQLVSFAKELKKDGAVYSSDLTDEGAKTLLSFRPRSGGGEGPSVSNAKGSVKFWLKDGALEKYEFHLTGTMSFNGNEMAQDRTSTVVIKDIGTTKVTVPDEAKKKLSQQMVEPMDRTRFAIGEAQRLAASCVVALLAACNVASASPITFNGAPAELTLSEVSERTLRIQLAHLDDHGRPVAGDSSTILAPFAAVEKLRVRELTASRELRIGRLHVTLRAQPLTVSVRRSNGKLVQELMLDDSTSTNSLSFHTEAPVLGLGEGEQQFDRRGHFYRMRNGQMAPWLATHGATIPVPFLIGTEGWALFIHRPWGEIDLRQAAGKFLFTRDTASRQPLDLFIINCDEPADALTEYVRLFGHPVMPPKWILGYIQSHRTLDGPEEPVRVAQTFREKKLPCDAVIYLGTGYCTNGWNTGHGSLEFNPNAFSQPAEQIKALHDLNFKVVFHINHAPRNMFGASVTEPSDSPLHIRNYWARHREDFALGVDGWWPDDGDELPIEARLARHRCYFEGPLQERPNVRPWSLHRNGFAGAARDGGWLWSGDVESRWATLAAHVPVGLNYSLSLTPFWGTDTGGFIPTREFTGELYVRWFQFSAFNALFRSHGRTWHLRLPWGWNTGETGPVESRDVTDRAELHNDQVEPICRKFLELRYRLLPYNYTLIRAACDTGLPPMRALWLHYPADPEAVKLGDEYLWGRHLLVAPVVEKGATMRRLYLPAGDWYDWWTGQKVAGGRWLERPVDLGTLPLYVCAGAIVPLDPVRQYTSQPVGEPTTLNIYPGADGTFTLYDDDGVSLDYTRNEASWTQFRWDDRRRTLTVEPDPRSKIKALERNFNVVLVPEGTRQTIQFAGKKVQVRLNRGAAP